MALHPVPLGGPTLTGLKLKAFAIASPALSSHVRPALVLGERESRTLTQSVNQQDVASGGRFSAGPACVQIWDRPWDHSDEPGSAVHLGSVDWSHDTPARHYVTVYRSMVTAAGLSSGETPTSILQAVLAISGLDIDDSRITSPGPPPRDPFRRTA